MSEQHETLRIALLWALITVVVEVAALAGLLPTIEAGRVAVSPALIPGGIMAAVLAPSVAGRHCSPLFAAAFWIAAAGVLVVLAVVYADSLHRPEVGGLTLAALSEELVYRLAAPMVLAVLAHRAGLAARWSVWFGFLLAAAWFVMLPGHTHQIATPAQAVPFVAYALLSAWIVVRSGAIIAVALVHAISNLAALLVWEGVAVPDARVWLMAGLLGLLAVGYALRSKDPSAREPLAVA